MRIMLILAILMLGALTLGNTAVAQNYLAIPIDSLHGYRDQIIPLRASMSTNFDEAHTQHLVQAPF